MRRSIINDGVDEGLMPRAQPPNDVEKPDADIPYADGPEGEISPRTNKPVYPKPVKPLDINLYATKKTVAQGMMDLALLTANANQLRYVLESGNRNGPYYYVSVTLISLSILMQLVVGVVLIFVGRKDVNDESSAHEADRLNNWLAIGITLIFLGRYNVNDDKESNRAEKLNNCVVLLVFLITSLNVFISAFGIDAVEKVDPILLVNAAMAAYKKDELPPVNAIEEPF